jgi:hypothetical protein
MLHNDIITLYYKRVVCVALKWISSFVNLDINMNSTISYQQVVQQLTGQTFSPAEINRDKLSCRE